MILDGCVLRAPLLLALASLLHASRTGRLASEKPPRSPRARQRMVNLCLNSSAVMKFPSPSSSIAANMSLTPWTYRDSFVESRIPRRISQAQCLTSGCLDPRGGGETASLQARPIKYQVLVLHIVPRQNLPTRRRRRQHQFQLGMEEITVGCTCVRPSVLLQP
ncbi:interleukin 17a/f3 [Salarias fasciatus]|uniref:interleukin 17a/f3 n=1 Tax=Salarias fasciatus TaxID=181472 RepID=UPI0011769E6E|nr:interleukin-17C-like [Salarias fasciatus]